MQSGITFAYLNHIKHKVSLPSYYDDRGADHTVTLHINPESTARETIGKFMINRRTPNCCPYCGSALSDERGIMPRPSEWSQPDPDNRVVSGKIGVRCITCNWWCINKFYVQSPAADDDSIWYCTDQFQNAYEGIIGRFSNKVWKDIMPNLAGELSEFRKGLASLSPGKETELFVGQLLSQYMNCDVRHVGRSHDAGIDLIVIKGDEQAAVQVKWRKIGRKRKSESVEQVREFIGAMLISGFKKGIFVTTDAAFSKDSQKSADKITRQYAPLNLISARELQEFLGVIVANQWREYKKQWACD
ncbi:MAG: restriction endonuclease [candidate division Zixibacteria bacterium]|nr:restriction endonuclease [candidate division Zixibacteria bacterium]